MAAVPVGQRSLAGGPRLGDDRVSGPAYLGLGPCRLAFIAGEHPQRDQVRLATRLMILYLLCDGHGNQPPSGCPMLPTPQPSAVRIPGTIVPIARTFRPP